MLTGFPAYKTFFKAGYLNADVLLSHNGVVVVFVLIVVDDTASHISQV